MPIFRFIKRKWLLAKPFPEDWQRILNIRVPVYKKLPPRLREILKKRLIIFLDEKIFEGCGGLTMTDEIRVVISAYACTLILEETSDYYSGLQAILVYPDDYMAPVHQEGEGGIVSVGYEPRSGEYWGAGSIVLSWNDIKKNIYPGRTGENLIYHEFSHLLDDRYGLTAGISDMGQPIRNDEWTRTFAKAYRNLVRNAKSGQTTVLDFYGAKNPAELFSVATEAFFENPNQLKSELPGLYEMLKAFYRLNPVTWPGF